MNTAIESHIQKQSIISQKTRFIKCLFVTLTLFSFVAFSLSNTNKETSDGGPSNKTKNGFSQVGNIQIKGIALVIQKEDPRLDSGENGLMTGMMSGTELSALLSYPNKRIISIDSVKSKVITFTDDKKFDLTKATDSRWGDEQPNSLDSQISNDGRSCLLTFTAPKSPSANAEKIHLKAQLILRCGAQIKTVEQIVALKAGSRFNKESVTLKLKSIEREQSNKKTNTILSFESNQNLDRVVKVTFAGANGKSIPSRVSGNGFTYDGNDAPTHHVIYTLTGKPQSVRMKVSFYSSVESLTIPLDLSYGLGL